MQNIAEAVAYISPQIVNNAEKDFLELVNSSTILSGFAILIIKFEKIEKKEKHNRK